MTSASRLSPRITEAVIINTSFFLNLNLHNTNGSLEGNHVLLSKIDSIYKLQWKMLKDISIEKIMLRLH
jgi:hypothetical protein